MIRFATALLVAAVSVAAEAPIQVVASIPNLKAIAVEVGGDLADVKCLARPDQDSYFVDPERAFLSNLRGADLLLVNGVELEIGWIPPLVDGSQNKRLVRGGPGYVDCSTGIDVLEISPPGTTRDEGDVHPIGNPHYLLDPLNAKTVAATIRDAFSRLRPAHASDFEGRCKAFCKKIDQAMFGEALVKEVGEARLWKLLADGQLWDFLAGRRAGDRPPSSALGGWLANMAPARGQRVIAYHDNMEYFLQRFGLKAVGYMEPKPGIPPFAKHCVDIVKTIEEMKVRVLLTQVFNEHKTTDLLARKTGTKVLDVPVECGGAEGTDTYLQLMDNLTRRIGAAFK